MAKTALELAVDTGRWDAGLRKAKSALDNFTEAGGGLQQSLAKDSEYMRKFVQMMGQTESTAKTAKGQLNDYKATIEQLTMQYNRMSEAQRASIGQDYLTAIDSLKQKYQAVNEEIREMNQSLGQTKAPEIPAGGDGGTLFGGGRLDGMLQVMGGNLMTKGVNLAIDKVASLYTEISDCVTQGIELARQGEGIRNAFERLGRGDILQGLREATHGTVTDLELMKAAVKFNDFRLPVEELGTMLAFAQQKAKDTGQSVDYMVDSIVTGLGRKSLMILDNLGLSAAEIKAKMKETGDMTKAVGAIIREQMAKAGDYVETAADRAAQANVSLQNKMEELGRKFGPLQEASKNFWTSMKISILDVVGGPLTDFLNKMTKAGQIIEKYKDLGGNDRVSEFATNLRNARPENRQGIYQQQQEQIWRYINRREQQIKDRRAHKTSIGNIGELQAEIDAAKKLLSEYQQAAQQYLKPVKAEINTTDGEQNVATLTQKLKGLEEQRKKAVRSGDQEQVETLTKQISQTKTNIGYLDPNALKTSTPKTQSDADRAQAKVNEALRMYQETITKSAIRMEAGLDSTLEGKKKELAGQERLFDAYNDAYATYANPKYKEAANEAADKMKTMASEVATLTAEHEAAKKAAQEQAAAQKKLADAQQAASEAMSQGNLKEYISASKKVEDAGGKAQTIPVTYDVVVNDERALQAIKNMADVTIAPKDITVTATTDEAAQRLSDIGATEIANKTFSINANAADVLSTIQAIDGVTIDDKTFTVTAETAKALRDINGIAGVKVKSVEIPFKATDNNIKAFVSELQNQLANTEVGSNLYNSLTAQLSDANMLASFIEAAVKNGVDMANFDVTGFWQKIFGDGSVAGDAISNMDWESWGEKLRELTGKSFAMDFTEGSISEDKDKGKDSSIKTMEKMIGGLSQVSSGLQQMGVVLPEGVKNLMGDIQGLMQVINGVQSIIQLFSTSTIAAQTASTTANTTMLSALNFQLPELISAIYANTVIPKIFAGGGIVGRAASGLLVGNSYSGDNRRMPVFGGGMIGVNDGELILNKAQQGVVASYMQSEDSGAGAAMMQPYVNGEQIILGVNNFYQRTGEGEIVTTRMLHRMNLQ